MSEQLRILVTGGAGFLGAWLCESLLSQGQQVICLDNYFTGRKDNIKHLLGNNNFEEICHDVTVPIELEVDQIYNLACPASPVHYQSDPLQTTRTTVLGAINMLELAKQNNATILQASTSEVYGDPAVHPQPESYWGHVNPIGIRACYDEGKRCAETLFFDYFREFNIPIRVARIFNTYGPGMDPNDGRVISNFIVQALSNKDITIYGDGSQTRSFCYRDDLVMGLIKLMNSDFIGPVNLGNPRTFSMLELAELVLELCASRSKLSYHKLPADDPVQRQPDISLASSKLNWKAEVELRQGLIKTIEYFQTVLAGKDDSGYV